MPSDADIRAKQTRMISVFRTRPEAARSTAGASAVVSDGLRCEFIQGDETATMDMPEIMGGTGTAPTPGFFARAGICGCVSIGIKQTAIKEGVNFRKVAVEVETDFDNAAMFGIGENSAAPLETRLNISIETDVPDAKVKALVRQALDMDPWFLALRDAQNVKTSISVGS